MKGLPPMDIVTVNGRVTEMWLDSKPLPIDRVKHIGWTADATQVQTVTVTYLVDLSITRKDTEE